MVGEPGPKMIRLLVPTASPATTAGRLYQRPTSVATVAFLHNGQPFYDDIAPLLVASLKGRAGVTVHEFRKPRYGAPADPVVLDEIAATADGAIVGLAC